MAYEINERLIRELREQANILLTGTHVLDKLVEEQGKDRDRNSLAAMNKSLYCILRTIDHLELSGTDKLPFRPACLDLAKLCRELGAQVESLSAELDVSFRWDAGEGPVFTLADKSLLTKAILSLLTNAVEAAGPGGKVGLRCSFIDGRYLITVSDDGPGLREPEASPNPFLKQPGGLGLGLVMARRIAELHGGAVMLENGEAGVRAVLSLSLQDPGDNIGDPSWDLYGGFLPVKVEFAPLLPLKSFLGRELD